MPTTNTLLAFTILSIGIILIPGPSNLFILAHGISRGRRSALAALIGVEFASALRVVLTAAGLSAVLASSAVVFDVIRWAGVGYLLYLAIVAIRTGPNQDLADAHDAPEPILHSARKGLIVALANPKMVIFFLALFPQFVHADRGSTVTQMLILGGIFWILGVAWDLGVACASSSFGQWLRHKPRVQRAQPRIEFITYGALAGWAATN